MIWRAHFTNTVGSFRRLDPPESDWTITDESLTVESNQGLATLRWSRFTGWWELPGFWMLFLGPAQFMTMPTSVMTGEQLAFIRSRIRPPGSG